MPAHQPQSVLIVDDSVETLEQMAELIEEFGHTPRAAQTVDQALALLADCACETAILDLRLRGESSLRLLEALPQPQAQPAIIFVSGLEDDILYSAHRAARDLGFAVTGVLTKPLDPDKLQHLLEVGSDPLTTVEPDEPAASRAEVRDALIDGEIIAAFQPQYSLHDATLVGIESLLRWRPKGGEALRGPGAFLPWLDNPDFRWQIFLLMCRHSAALLREQTFDDVDCRVSINAPAAIFEHREFPSAVLDLCQSAGIGPQRLTFELTECDLELSPAQARGLTKARVLGFGLSMDDFGSGTSNLQRLAEYPFSEVKVDAWFLNEAFNSERRKWMIRSVAEICRDRHVFSVVEGIESEEMLELAIELHFDCGQGYYLGMPSERRALAPFAVKSERVGRVLDRAAPRRPPLTQSILSDEEREALLKSFG